MKPQNVWPAEMEEAFFTSPGGLSAKKKFKKHNPQFNNADIEKFYNYHPVVSRFYGVKYSSDKKEYTQKCSANYFGHRIHIDLAMFPADPDQTYLVVAIDNFTRYTMCRVNKIATILSECSSFNYYNYSSFLNPRVDGM